MISQFFSFSSSRRPNPETLQCPYIMNGTFFTGKLWLFRFWWRLLSFADDFSNSLDPDPVRQSVGPDLDSTCLTLSDGVPEIGYWKSQVFTKSARDKEHEILHSMQIVNPQSANHNCSRRQFLRHLSQFSKKKKNKVWYFMRIVCRRFSWNIMPYLLILKKRQNF